MRRAPNGLAGRLTALALLLNILLPVLTVLGHWQPPELRPPASLQLEAQADICTASEGPHHAPPAGHHSGVVCPLCVLLGSQTLGPLATAMALPPRPEAFSAPLPPTHTASRAQSPRRPQAARAPPILA